MLARLALCVVMIALAVAQSPTKAQAQAQVDRIAAVVNDEVITMMDVETRVRMAMALSNLQDSADARRRVVPQVVRKMIDERLQLQEAERLKISMTPAEVDQGIAMIEQQNRQAKGTLLKALQGIGVDPSAVREQVRADLTWMRVVARVLRPTIRIGEEEVNDRLDTIKSHQGQPEYNAAEIFLPVESPDQEDEMRRLAERLIEQLKTGVAFPSLARQFSRAPTAATGGAMGWVSRGMLDDELLQALESMQPGQVSPVIRAADGFHLMALLDRRVAGTSADPANTTVALARLILPVPADGPPKDGLMARAQELTRGARTCDDLEVIGRKLAVPTNGRLPATRIGELPDHLRRAVGTLPAGRVSAPIDVPEGIMVAMVCERTEATTAQLPTAEAVRRTIEDERVDMLARRYLRDLRRAAFVDVRI
jgi:peptidyl-prolyl cis-trans isomerase SurA